MMGARKVTISNNTVDHYYYGALIKSCKKMTVKNNTFKNTSICGVAMDGCDKNNGRRWFSVTNKKRKKKLSFTCPYILHGTVTTKGATYSFTAKDGKASVKFPKKPKKGQQIDFYGKDAWNNKYYRTYYAK
jgi:parallel beta-helix repeat protein